MSQIFLIPSETSILLFNILASFANYLKTILLLLPKKFLLYWVDLCMDFDDFGSGPATTHLFLILTKLNIFYFEIKFKKGLQNEVVQRKKCCL